MRSTSSSIASVAGDGSFLATRCAAAMGVLISCTQVSVYSRYSRSRRRASATRSRMARVPASSTSWATVPSSKSGLATTSVAR